MHQLLHHASRLRDGEKAPFRTAILQSNAIVSVCFCYHHSLFVTDTAHRTRTTPKTPAELGPQFEALCRALLLDPSAPDILETLRDTHRVPWSAITYAIENDALGVVYGTFRGCWEPAWIGDTDTMAWQRTGGFARGLAAHGVRAVVVGDLTEEWYIYSLSHPIASVSSVAVKPSSAGRLAGLEY